MGVIVTNKQSPSVQPDTILVVEQYIGTPVPSGRLPKGVYYADTNGKWVPLTDAMLF